MRVVDVADLVELDFRGAVADGQWNAPRGDLEIGHDGVLAVSISCCYLVCGFVGLKEGAGCGGGRREENGIAPCR